MTTEEILLTVLTIAIVVLITMVLAVLFLVLKIAKKINTTVDGMQHAFTNGSQMVQSLAPVSFVTVLYRIFKVMKKRK